MCLGSLYPYLDEGHTMNNPYQEELLNRLRDHENARGERELTRLINWATSAVLKYTAVRTLTTTMIEKWVRVKAAGCVRCRLGSHR